MKINLNKTQLKWIGIGILIGVVLALLIRPSGRQSHNAHETNVTRETKSETIWTCSMHPQIQLPKPGKCPLCGMNLIPVRQEQSKQGDSQRTLVMSPLAKKLAQIQTTRVTREFVNKEIRMGGKVEYDETRLDYITAWVSGRIDRLYIDYTGIMVRKGDHMAYIYSPELLSAQEEYLQAIKNVKDIQETHLEVLKASSVNTVVNAREKMKLLGITEKQIKELEQRGEPRDHMTLYAPVGGVVIEKHVNEGDYVKTGDRIYTIADLSRVWIKLDAYESDIQWLRYGQQVEFESEAYPGKFFKGVISFIDPILNEKTRSVKVRVSVDNSDHILKPGMFVRAKVFSRLASFGKVVMDSSLAGKWISPMHPEIVKNEPGVCDICGMALVKAEELGYISSDSLEGQVPLVIPATAPLLTGKRAVVYVDVSTPNETKFEGREIVLGPRAGDYYIVIEGLSEGEWVVTNGNFKIDSALQIQAKPSMMNPRGGGSGGGGHQHGGMSMSESQKTMEKEIQPEGPQSLKIPDEFRSQLKTVYNAYFEIQSALAGDDLNAAQTGLANLLESLEKADNQLLSKKWQEFWMELKKEIEDLFQHGQTLTDLQKFRDHVFTGLSDQIVILEKHFRHNIQPAYYEMFCPMADGGKGALWMQSKSKIQNPYFGQSMIGCGEITQTFDPKK